MSNHVIRAYAALNGAHYVRVDRERLLALVWNGAKTINVYSLLNWTALDIITINTETVETAIEEYLERRS